MARNFLRNLDSEEFFAGFVNNSMDESFRNGLIPPCAPDTNLEHTEREDEQHQFAPIDDEFVTI